MSEFYLKRYALCRWSLLAPRGCNLGRLVPPSWHPGGPFWHLRGPWEQQDGLERVRHMIFIDLVLIWGSYFESFLGTDAGHFNLCSGLFLGNFLYRLWRRNLDDWGS